MEDHKIIDLYWGRNEEAIRESSEKYGGYCRTIAYNILFDDNDSEECVNDTWLRAWTAIPPAKPGSLKAFLGRITRNLAIDRYDAAKAQKRGGGTYDAALDEIGELVADASPQSKALEELELTEILNTFLQNLSPEKRKLFMRRYWYMDSIRDIADFYSVSESKVKTTLFRTREELKAVLEKEGITI